MSEIMHEIYEAAEARRLAAGEPARAPDDYLTTDVEVFVRKVCSAIARAWRRWRRRGEFATPPADAAIAQV